jgi:hypothetical protein
MNLSELFTGHILKISEAQAAHCAKAQKDITDEV